ncbi:Urb2/Npa2 family-domain-containing protein [Pisolithus tinctorius]|nr:Urb2/Npa2 family-domain-containing protein [Pisolithus tinctorius]
MSLLGLNLGRVCINTYKHPHVFFWGCPGSQGGRLPNTRDRLAFHTIFLSTHMLHWTRTLSPSIVSQSLNAQSSQEDPSSKTPKQLHDTLYYAGIETLFSVEGLRQPLDTLLDALSRVCTDHHGLSLLPCPFAARLCAVSRHRTTLFPSSSGSASPALAIRETVRADAMEVLLRDTVTVDSGPQRTDAWMALVGILDVVEKERLYIPHTTVGSGNRNTVPGPCAGQVCNSNDVSVVTLAIDVLDVLVRVECELIGSETRKLLGAIVSLRLLSDLLEYHTKTRTVHILPESVSSQSLPIPPHDVIALQLGPAVLEELTRVWKAYTAERGQSRRGGEEISAKGHDDDDGTLRSKCHSLAVGFTYVARVSGAVLASLPPYAYVPDTQNQGVPWDEVGKLGWDIAWECMRHGRGESQEVAPQREDESKRKRRKKWQRERERQGPDMQGSDDVASAALRCLYDVRARLIRVASSPMPVTLGPSDVLGSDEIEELLGVVGDEGTSAELVLEIVRTLFAQVSQTRGSQQAQAGVITKTSIDVLIRHFSPQSRWCGSSAALTRENLGVALLYVLADRWIGVIDAAAPEEVLQRFICLLLTIPLGLPFGTTNELHGQLGSHHDILLLVLRNAQFWDLPNMRGAFLSFALKQTSLLSSSCFLPGSTGTNGLDKLELLRASEVYTLLMYVPPKYFTRASRMELVKRAVGGDVAICSVLQVVSGGGTADRSDREHLGKGKDMVDSPQKSDAGYEMDMDEEDDSGVRMLRELCVHHLTVFRAFLYRMGQFTNALDCTTSRAYVEHLLQSPSKLAMSPDALTKETLNLVSFHLFTLLRAQNSEASAAVASILSSLVAAQPFPDTLSQGLWQHVLTRSVVFRLIECLREHHSPGSLATVVVSALRTLYGSFTPILVPAGGQSRTSGALALSDHVEARSYALSFGQWLGIDITGSVAPIGIKLATGVMRSPLRSPSLPVGADRATMCPRVLALLFEELRCFPNISDSAYLETIAALCSIHGTEMEVRYALDMQVTKATAELSVDSFAHLLSVIGEGIEDPWLPVGQCKSLMHLSTILLHDTPQGPLEVVQVFVTRCLDAFNDQPHLYGGSMELKEHYLELIAKHCSDRPAAVRSADLGSIWSLLCKILSGSTDHATATSFATFHCIVSIAGSLVRMRRDIVIHTLPHLAFVLHRLLLIIRRMRPQLGAKQSKLVAGTLPSWISPSQPLGIAESRALSRLLTALTVKTVPHTHTTQHTAIAAETQKAESLAKPFAKHVGHVLLAYIDSMNNPLCILTPDIRREVEPGLFSLCEMLGEYNRGALMVSALDSGGKTLMKSLWREYEKQRYVGKG